MKQDARPPAKPPHTIPIQIKVLTPLSIGAGKGERLSPYTDFIIEGGKALLLDHKRLEADYLRSRPELAAELADQILQQMDHNVSGFNLRNFLTNRLQVRDLHSITRPLPQLGLRAELRQHIAAIVKTQGRPYIPGSTFKGALRTAIWYSWLTQDPAGIRTLDGWCEQLRKPGNAGHLLAGIHDRNLMGSFGKQASKEFPPDAHLFRAADSDPFPEGSLMLLSMNRIHLRSGKAASKNIPTPREAIAAGARTRASLSIRPELQHGALKRWNTEPRRELAAVLNRFSGDFLEMERQVLERLDTELPLETWYRDMEVPAGGGQALLRLGGGKTYFNNSIGLAVWRQSPELFFKLLKATGKFSKADAALFPRTRTVTPRNEPPGWVILQF